MIVVDAKDMILGKLAARVAKLALSGETIRVINCEHVIVTGSKEVVFAKFLQRTDRGIPLKGPYYPRQSDRIVRRAIRGMLPYKLSKGLQAYKRVLCYTGVPSEFAGTTPVVFSEASIANSNAPKYVYLGEISKLIGGSR